MQFSVHTASSGGAPLVAAVYDDVAGLHELHEAVDGGVHGRAGLDEDDYSPARCALVAQRSQEAYTPTQPEAGRQYEQCWLVTSRRAHLGFSSDATKSFRSL